jgi:single-strand DNA-binding protein
MSKGLNKVMLIGHLGNAPEVKTTSGGMMVAKVSLATNSSKKNKDTGAWVDETEWHRVVMFDRLAEVAQQYMRKGSQVYIEGRLRTNKWQDKDGNDRYTTDVVASDMQMLGGRGDGGDAQQERQAPAQNTAPRQTKHDAEKSNGYSDFDDDVPF